MIISFPRMAMHPYHTAGVDVCGCSYNVEVIPTGPGEYSAPSEGHELSLRVHCGSDTENFRLHIVRGQPASGALDLVRWFEGRPEHVPSAAHAATFMLINRGVCNGWPRAMALSANIVVHTQGHHGYFHEEKTGEDDRRPTPASRAVEALEKVLINGAERETCCAVCLLGRV